MNKVIVTPNHQVSAEKDLGPKARTVLQAARTVFLTHGFAGATTDMIQREAGVSKSTVYAHFANKETLFSEVVKAECLSSANNIRSIQFIPGQTARLLQDVAEAYLDIVVSKSGASLAQLGENILRSRAQAKYSIGCRVIGAGARGRRYSVR